MPDAKPAPAAKPDLLGFGNETASAPPGHGSATSAPRRYDGGAHQESKRSFEVPSCRHTGHREPQNAQYEKDAPDDPQGNDQVGIFRSLAVRRALVGVRSVRVEAHRDDPSIIGVGEVR
jgi:hypothetical protein